MIGSIGAHLCDRGRSLLVVAHTGRAVDRALVEITQQLGDELGAGEVLRLGVPCDHRLCEREDLLFEAVVWNRQEQLRERRSWLEPRKAAAQKRLAESERLIALAAWAGEGRAELADFLVRLRTLRAPRGGGDPGPARRRLLGHQDRTVPALRAGGLAAGGG